MWLLSKQMSMVITYDALLPIEYTACPREWRFFFLVRAQQSLNLWRVNGHALQKLQMNAVPT